MSNDELQAQVERLRKIIANMDANAVSLDRRIASGQMSIGILRAENVALRQLLAYAHAAPNVLGLDLIDTREEPHVNFALDHVDVIRRKLEVRAK